MGIITVARQMGSDGDRIAERAAEVLGYEYVDRRLVEEIATITDTTPDEVEKYDEKGEGRVKHFLKRLLVPEMSPGGFPLSSAAYFPEFGLEFPYVMERESDEVATYLDRGTYQLLITTLLQDYGDTGKAVILGRASQIIMAGRDDAFHVKIIAPFQARCQRIMEAQEMSLDAAKDLVEQHDRWRQLYLKNYHNADWDDLLLYHLTINTGKMDAEDAVDLMVRYAARNN
ncbi:MAG TPA: cytidylate kinase-like family protein [Candidatus Latescibacteria bacterium]|nr:cytidylate kinase-like family protein [Candidatus Latescibacterota bacterium]